jgi:hypothetical protein
VVWEVEERPRAEGGGRERRFWFLGKTEVKGNAWTLDEGRERKRRGWKMRRSVVGDVGGTGLWLW